jgi:hypothetical protein
MPCKKEKRKSGAQTPKPHGTLSTFSVPSEGENMKPKLKSKNQVKTKNYEFIDWLLAIDASVM